MKERSIIVTMAKRLAAGMLCIWLLSMALSTLLLAGDLERQGAEACAKVLEQTLADYKAEQERLGEWKIKEMLVSLPEVRFTPTLDFPLLRPREMNIWHAALTVGESRTIIRSEGLDIGVAEEAYTGFTVREGKLYIHLTSDMLANSDPSGYDTHEAYGTAGTNSYSWYKYASYALPNPFLTFRAFPLRKGSFPCGEMTGDYPVTVEHDPLKPASRGNLTPEALMDDIESRTLHFDSHRLIQGSQLRGVWLLDGEGNKRCFILGAYGWCPLIEAAAALRSVYLLSFAVFQLLGILVWLSFRHSLAQPLRKRAEAVMAEPLSVSRREYDYLMPFREVRGTMASGLMRRQMMQASQLLPSIEGRAAEECPLLLTELQRAEGKLMPILIDRGQKITRELKADGRVHASPLQLEDVLLALFREAVEFTEQNEEMVLRTMEKSGFLLTEIEIRTKRRLKELDYERLWDGIYRSPADGDAPGAKLRNAMWRLPGAFAAVRKTKKGLALTLGLPKKE